MESINPEETATVAVPFGSQEMLRLHQLRLLEWFATTGQKRRLTGEAVESEVVEPVPDRWELTRGIQPYEWQTECIARWFASGRRGTVKVVTGAPMVAPGEVVRQYLSGTLVTGDNVCDH